METTYRVLRIEEQMYGCEELPAGQPVLCLSLIHISEPTRPY